jgi:hypothetical protein
MYVHWDYSYLAHLMRKASAEQQPEDASPEGAVGAEGGAVGGTVAGKGRKHLVVMLRHPVKRVLSEYYFCTKAGSTCSAPQFDYSPHGTLYQHIQAEDEDEVEAGGAGGSSGRDRHGAAGGEGTNGQAGKQRTSQRTSQRMIQRISLEDFIRAPNNPAHNRQTRYLSGTKRVHDPSCFPTALKDNGLELWEVPQFKDWMEVQREHGHQWPLDTSPADLGRALDHLYHNVTVLGLTERYEETRQMLTFQLGWRFEDADPKKWRVSTPKGAFEELDAELLTEIEQLNAHDMALYAHATALFEQRLELRASLLREFSA